MQEYKNRSESLRRKPHQFNIDDYRINPTENQNDRDNRFWSPEDGSSRSSRPYSTEGNPYDDYRSVQYPSNPDAWGRDRGFDSPRPGKHYGAGPKGYARSDERIYEEVCEALYQDSDVDASQIEVMVKNGEVTLKGTVSDRLMKRCAEDCAEEIAGVKDVINQLRIQNGLSK